MFYFDLNITLHPNTSSLITYRDELLFVVEPEQVSFIDVSQLSFNPVDRKNPVTKVKKQRLFTNELGSRRTQAVGMIVISRGPQAEIMTQFQEGLEGQEADIKNNARYMQTVANFMIICLSLLFGLM